MTLKTTIPMIFWQGKNQRTGESGEANGTGSTDRSAADAREEQSLAQLHIAFCWVPREDRQRTFNAADILSPGIRKRAEKAYVKHYINGWFYEKGHNR